MNTKIVERSILHYTNRERKRQDRKKLIGSRSLIRAARGHSRWMARRNRFSHTVGGGSQPWHRAQRAGFPSSIVSENIWQISGITKSALHWHSSWRIGRGAVRSWMNSPGHRRNLLDSDVQYIGVGVARNKGGRIYATQNFGRVNSFAKSPSREGTAKFGWLGIGILIALGLLIYLNWAS